MSEEEQCLFMIRFHQEQYAKLVKPYLDKLAHIRICKTPNMIVTPEQYELIERK